MLKFPSAILLLSSVLISCRPGIDEPLPPGPGTFGIQVPKYAADIQPLWDGHCLGAGCHVSPTDAGSLNLEPGISHGELFDVAAQLFCDPVTINGNPVSVGMLVDGTGQNPAMSVLMHRLNNHLSCLPVQNHDTGTLKLTKGQKETIRQWILNGAKND